jgi:hypothetical protein
MTIDAVGKDASSLWILVKSQEFADCWIEAQFLHTNDIDTLPVINPGIILVTSTPVPATEFPTATTVIQAGETPTATTVVPTG